MEIEIIQGPQIIQIVAGRPCKECEEEKAQKDLQEEILAEADRVTLSGKSPLDTGIASGSAPEGLDNNGEIQNPGVASQTGPRSKAELSPEEKQALDDLKARDREVRAHEQAHLAAAGPYAKGPPSFEYQTGPDGKPYAVGGEVQIDTSKVSGNPQATLVKAQTIRRAANAPRNPSAQDRQVAAQAAQLEAEARQEIKEQRTEKLEQTQETGKSVRQALLKTPPYPLKIPNQHPGVRNLGRGGTRQEMPAPIPGFKISCRNLLHPQLQIKATCWISFPEKFCQRAAGPNVGI